MPNINPSLVVESWAGSVIETFKAGVWEKYGLPGFTIDEIAIFVIILHVVNYNVTAHLEYKTRIFTRIFGARAIYLYIVYLILSAEIRNAIVKQALINSSATLTPLPSTNPSPPPEGFYLGWGFWIVGVFLNIWTLYALGFKGMYNGDSFGWLMDSPVTSGPYAHFDHPQYVGTALVYFGNALFYWSAAGMWYTFVLFVTFLASANYIETPHMSHIYSTRKTSKLYCNTNGVRIGKC